MLKEFLKRVIDTGGSDLHLRAYERPIIRIQNKLKRQQDCPILSPEVLKEMIFGIMNEYQREKFQQTLELDFSYSLDTLARFRVNVMREKGNIGAVFRLIPYKIRTIDELGLPEILKEVANYTYGLVLVTGPTGAGKSTTLAALIEHINTTRRCNIITIEDPIEYVFTDKLSVISQREVGEDVPFFKTALKYVTRENPDIIFVGEMRDIETMRTAIECAETGILVLSTLHTNNATQTIDRIIDSFPPQERHQIKIQLASTIRAIFSQVLLPRIDKEDRIAAFEIMTATPAVKSLLREGKSHLLYSVIQASGQWGMQTLEMDLVRLCSKGIISYEEALAHAADTRQFLDLAKRYLKIESF